MGRNPAGNWGPQGAPAPSPSDRMQPWSAQLAPTAGPPTQAHHEAALGDGRVRVLLAKAPTVRQEGVPGLGTPGTGMLPNADSVRLAGRILSVADEQATAVREAAEQEAAEITRQASGQATAVREAAEREATEIKRQASGQATAIRAAAEEEAAELRAALMTMSAELSRAATYVTENLAIPMTPATKPIARPLDRPATKPSDRPATKPASRPATKPASRPATKPASRPATKRSDRPATKPGGQPRQYAAMRLTKLVTAALVVFAVIAGTTEIGLHGFSFFVFRSAGTGSTPSNGIPENQGPGQPDAPGAHRHPTGHKP
jgi:hypothetical protein